LAAGTDADDLFFFFWYFLSWRGWFVSGVYEQRKARGKLYLCSCSCRLFRAVGRGGVGHIKGGPDSMESMSYGGPDLQLSTGCEMEMSVDDGGEGESRPRIVSGLASESLRGAGP
jgi:hypothetical protein